MNINFEKYADGLAPAIVQDAATGRVLMLGFMNREALDLTIERGKATFFSRTRRGIWTKGETSGNFLNVVQVLTDCDNDTILVRAIPAGPTCHTGADTCFGESNEHPDFLFELERVVRQRRDEPDENSYTSKLFARGINKVAQKVGEEAVELVIEAKDDDRDLFKNEAADLLYHLMVLLAAKDVSLGEVMETLKERRK